MKTKKMIIYIKDYKYKLFFKNKLHLYFLPLIRMWAIIFSNKNNYDEKEMLYNVLSIELTSLLQNRTKQVLLKQHTCKIKRLESSSSLSLFPENIRCRFHLAS